MIQNWFFKHILFDRPPVPFCLYPKLILLVVPLYLFPSQAEKKIEILEG